MYQEVLLAKLKVFLVPKPNQVFFKLNAKR